VYYIKEIIQKKKATFDAAALIEEGFCILETTGLKRSGGMISRVIQDRARILETQKDTRKERPNELERGAANMHISKK
jgi:hypothetical protein